MNSIAFIPTHFPLNFHCFFSSVSLVNTRISRISKFQFYFNINNRRLLSPPPTTKQYKKNKKRLGKEDKKIETRNKFPNQWNFGIPNTETNEHSLLEIYSQKSEKHNSWKTNYRKREFQKSKIEKLKIQKYLSKNTLKPHYFRKLWNSSSVYPSIVSIDTGKTREMTTCENDWIRKLSLKITHSRISTTSGYRMRISVENKIKDRKDKNFETTSSDTINLEYGKLWRVIPSYVRCRLKTLKQSLKADSWNEEIPDIPVGRIQTMWKWLRSEKPPLRRDTLAFS